MTARPWTRKRIAYVTGQVLVAGIVGYYVVRTVLDLTRTDAFDSLTFDVGKAAIAVALLVLYNLLFVHTSQLVLLALGERVGFGAAFELNYASALGKYVPGGVWHVVGRFALADSLQVRKRSVAVMTVFENALGVISGILVAALGLGTGAAGRLGLPVWLAPVVAVVSLLSLHPAVFGRLMRLGLRLAGSDQASPDLSFWRTLALVIYRSLVWIVAGLGFMFYTQALSAGAPGTLTWYSGVFAAGSVVGLLVIFTPGGIGVREAAFTALLTPVLGVGVAGTVGLTSRLWTTAVELGLSGAAVAISARRIRRDLRATVPESDPPRS